MQVSVGYTDLEVSADRFLGLLDEAHAVMESYPEVRMAVLADVEDVFLYNDTGDSQKTSLLREWLASSTERLQCRGDVHRLPPVVERPVHARQ